MLNKQQLELVEAPPGKIICIAGAGTGKTFCIIQKIKYAIEHQKIKPETILAITFTRKAANEMKERLALLLGDAVCQHLTIGTVNSFCFNHIIIPNLKYLGYYTNQRPQILIEGYKTLLKGMYPSVKLTYINHLAYKIDYYLTRCLDFPEDEIISVGEFKDITLKQLLDEIRKYQFQNQLITFTDQIVFAHQILENNISFRKKVSSRYKLVIVDEAQDNNYMQNKLVLHLSEQHKNIIAVGDDAQSIYRFRGADPDFFLDLHKKENFKLFTLTTNYRSNQAILDLGNSILEPNFKEKANIEKILVAHKQTNAEKPRLRAFINDSKLEVDFIVNEVKKYIEYLQYKDIAILSRSVLSGVGRFLQASFRNEGIPYQVVGGGDIAKSPHVRRMFAAFALGCGYTHKEDWIELLMLFRGIGEIKSRKIADTLDDLEKIKIPDDVKNGIHSLKNLIIEISKNLKNPKICFDLFYDWYFYTVDINSPNIEYEDILRAQRVLHILGSTIEGKDLETAVENIKMDESKKEDDLETQDKNKITISTIHRSKGLEWPYVIVADCHDEMMPHKNCCKTPQDVQEECRIFHVAATRAKENLLLTATCYPDHDISPFIDTNMVQYEGNDMVANNIAESDRIEFGLDID